MKTPEITIEPDGDTKHEPCADCGSTTRSVTGFAYQGDACIAAYLARWTEAHLERGVQMQLSIGRWGDGTDATMRSRVAIECRMDDDRPSFKVVDASAMPWGKGKILGKGLSRPEAMADPIRQMVFDILDQVVFD